MTKTNKIIQESQQTEVSFCGRCDPSVRYCDHKKCTDIKMLLKVVEDSQFCNKNIDVLNHLHQYSYLLPTIDYLDDSELIDGKWAGRAQSDTYRLKADEEQKKALLDDQHRDYHLNLAKEQTRLADIAEHSAVTCKMQYLKFPSKSYRDDANEETKMGAVQKSLGDEMQKKADEQDEKAQLVYGEEEYEGLKKIADNYQSWADLYNAKFKEHGYQAVKFVNWASKMEADLRNKARIDYEINGRIKYSNMHYQQPYFSEFKDKIIPKDELRQTVKKVEMGTGNHKNHIRVRNLNFIFNRNILDDDTFALLWELQVTDNSQVFTGDVQMLVKYLFDYHYNFILLNAVLVICHTFAMFSFAASVDLNSNYCDKTSAMVVLALNTIIILKDIIRQLFEMTESYRNGRIVGSYHLQVVFEHLRQFIRAWYSTGSQLPMLLFPVRATIIISGLPFVALYSSLLFMNSVLRDLQNICGWSVTTLFFGVIWANISGEYFIENTETIKWVMQYIVVAQGLRMAIAIFMIFESSRPLMILMKNVILNMIPLIVFGFIMYSFEITQIQNFLWQSLDDCFHIKLINYNLQSPQAFIPYFIGCSFVAIILLNYLNSISNTFSQDQQVSNTKAICQMLFEISVIYKFKKAQDIGKYHIYTYQNIDAKTGKEKEIPEVQITQEMLKTINDKFEEMKNKIEALENLNKQTQRRRY